MEKFARYSIREISCILGNPVPNQRQVAHFTIDSRKVQAGGLFFAIQGACSDGHDHLREVAKSGGVCAVVFQGYQGPSWGLELIRVCNVKRALHALAKWSFAKRKERVVAITGSMGKTTTKEFLTQLLSSNYKVAKTQGNQNTQLTLPLTLLNLHEAKDFLVLEMGMGAHGDIEKLIDLAPPELAIVTRIAPAGIKSYEGGLEAIAQAKGEIFTHPSTQRGLISSQASRFPSILHRGDVEKSIYGFASHSDQGDQLHFSSSSMGQRMEIRKSRFLPVSFHLGFSASHLQENFLAAASAAHLVGLPWEAIQGGATKLRPYERRFESFEKDRVTFIDDSYNANPHSVKAALENLPKGYERRIGVLGEMVDLGEASIDFHVEVGQCAAQHLDYLLCIGKGAEPLFEAFGKTGKGAEMFFDVESIQKRLSEVALPGDLVLLKGANCWRLWELVER